MPCVFSSVFIIVTPTSLSSSEVCDTSVKSQQQLRNNTQHTTVNRQHSISANFFDVLFERDYLAWNRILFLCNSASLHRRCESSGQKPVHLAISLFVVRALAAPACWV